jgi:hypothetical protein
MRWIDERRCSNLDTLLDRGSVESAHAVEFSKTVAPRRKGGSFLAAHPKSEPDPERTDKYSAHLRTLEGPDRPAYGGPIDRLSIAGSVGSGIPGRTRRGRPDRTRDRHGRGHGTPDRRRGLMGPPSARRETRDRRGTSGTTLGVGVPPQEPLRDDLDDHVPRPRPVVEVDQDDLLPGAERQPALDDRHALRGADDRGADVGV